MSNNSETSFSPREMEVLALAWQCMESEPKIDMQKLADLTGYTRGSASVTLGKIKRKMKTHAASASETNIPTTPRKSSSGTSKAKTPKSTGKRAANGENSPAKKHKSTSTKKHDDYDDEEEYTSANIKCEEATNLAKEADEFYSQGAYSNGYDEDEDYNI